MDDAVRGARGGRDDGRPASQLANLAHRNGGSPAHKAVNRVDDAIERGADRLEGLAREMAAESGFKAKLAPSLAEDAAFLRKLKPSLIAARARGEAPTDAEPGSVTLAPAGPQLGRRPKPPRTGGPNPFVIVGGALAVGILLAKVLDWRGHAHPRA